MDNVKVRREGDELVYEMRVKITGKSMLEQEMAIQEAANIVGCRATADALKAFDTNGKPILVNGVKHTSKGEQTETYECPFGKITVPRHVYQNTNGGKTFCPMEHAARMILNSTPKYAKLLSYYYGKSGARSTSENLLEHTGRIACHGYVKKVSEVVGACAQFFENIVVYELPADIPEPAQIAISLDGTCMLMIKDGWREAMAGTISFYDSEGERTHTIYIGAAPEHGKGEFTKRFEREIQRVKTKYPDAQYIGLADGAKTNWDFLKKWTDLSIIDFYHASEYAAKAVKAMFPSPSKEEQRKQWLKDALHKLKHKNGAAKRLLNEFTDARLDTPKYYRADMDAAITYFTNHYRKMNYARQTKINMPIGSGVVEAACKELIKQRMANSGMRWHNAGAAIVISIRSLILSGKRWEQFWKRIDESGCPAHKKFSHI
jgi:hypothetical protein